MPAPLHVAHAEALHVAAVKIANAREDRDEAIRQAFADGMPVAAIADAVGLTPARIYQLGQDLQLARGRARERR